MKNKKHISAPSIQDEKELLGILDNSADGVKIRNSVFSFRFLNGHGQHKITQILLSDSEDSKISCKCLAAAWLNGYFKIKFLWWFVWRWFYYIRQYSEEELTEAIALIKKKVPLKAYLLNTTLLIGMRETMMQMNKNEVLLTLRERSGDKDGNYAKNGNG